MIKTNDELLELFEDVDKFNSYMKDYGEKIKQDLLLSIPVLVLKFVQNNANYTTTVENFYKDNEEFKNHKPLAQGIINTISAENPELSVEEVFAKAIPMVKQKIKEIKDAKITA